MIILPQQFGEIVKPMYTDRVNNCLKQFLRGEPSYMNVRMIVGLALLALGILSIILAAMLRYRKSGYAMLPGMIGAVITVIGALITTVTLFY